VPGTLDYMLPSSPRPARPRLAAVGPLRARPLPLRGARGNRCSKRLPTDLNSAWLRFQDRIRKPPAIGFDAEAFDQYPRLKPVILRALAEKPAGRFASAADMRVALEEALKPETPPAEHAAAFDPGELTMATFIRRQPVGPG
jgi:hypothetical protein